ncbi:cytochrome c biogenesis CcdA family protein [Haloarcula montana]|uniref:cytochrome c biogenesis CcdA family protein n=1 Tax=Haloarcula montana TaxID=3111776 RepID=UPI002D770E75|nr:cytochrome c biogenesis protein CcdA [Haloarcula sp. GH36]
MSVGIVTFAFGAGVTTFAAPCVFPLLPGYVGYFADRHGDADTGPVRHGLVAAAGVLTVFAALSGAVYVLDKRVVQSLGAVEPLAGGVMIALGGVVLGGVAPSLRVPLPRRRDTAAGVFLFGAVYAVAAAGCTVPILLGVVAQALTMAPLSGATVVSAYAMGVALPMVGATVATGYGADVVTAGLSTRTVRRVAGVTMIGAGALQMWAGFAAAG